MSLFFRHWLGACGIKPRTTLRALARLPGYWREYRAFRRMVQTERWIVAPSQPCLLDHVEPGGTASGHYFHQDLFVAQRIYARNPKRHCDVGSRVDGFVAHVAAFRTIEYFDLRPINSAASNIVFRCGDLLDAATLPQRECDSVSALHVIEHIGLGRYGDRMIPGGWRRALRHLAGMLEPEGVLYLSVPVGRQRIEFNAHRVFSPHTISDTAKECGLVLESFAWVDDSGAFHPPTGDGAMIPPEVGELHYGCGIYEFRASRHIA